jgi:hypothetical protein
VLQGLAVMAIRGQREVFDHLRDFVTQHRNLARVAAVRRGSPQTQETLLTHQLALRSEVLHADVVEISGAVNRRQQVRLGHEDDVAGTALAADVARQRAVGAVRLPVAAAQNAEPRRVDRPQDLPPGAPLQPIFTVPQKSEVAIFHPREQCDRFAQDAGFEARALGAQGLRRLMSRALHLGPVRARDPNIAHAALDLRRERVQSRGIDDPVHLDMLKRFQP